jgi:hypothetical protein
MLQIDHLRRRFSDTETIGEFRIDGSFFCYTLEDPVRREKIPGKTAIPPGRYRMVLTYSPRFKRELPGLQDVPGFTHILIHSGNGPEHTSGCVLLGEGVYNNRLTGSREAVARFLKLFKAGGGEAWLNIKETMTIL